jgi:hypothetical protein
MSKYDKRNPPPLGTLIEVDIIFVSRTCGSVLVGYSAGSDDTYLFLSYKTNGSKDSQIGWNAISEIRSTSSGQICIET